MKKIVGGQKLQDDILESIHLMCDTVKITLGPVGNNVLIDHSSFSPFITNDGVTIAKNIESDDPVKGSILEIIKEASIKTNEVVGDGTTTTLVLLESLYEESIKFINEGMSPILLKRKLEKILEDILTELEKLKREAKDADLKHIANISSGDEELGNLAYQVMKKVKQKNAITIKEIDENKIEVNYLKGYIFKTIPASSYFFRDTHKLNFKNAYVLLMNAPFISVESISFLINEILENKQDLLIVANYFDEEAIQELVALSINKNLNICLLKIEEYGMNTYEVLKDLQSITHANIIEQNNMITSKDIGFAQNVEITNDNTKIDFKITSSTKNYLAKLKQKLNNMTSELEKEFYERRIAMFLNGTAEIKLGASTKTECLEKRMRLEDALCALSVSNEGILAGGGISLLQIASNLKSEDEATKIWTKALQKPFEQIYNNAGLDYLAMKNDLENNNYHMIYNISKISWEDCNSTYVIDPFLVVKQSLLNALSIAGMLITTNSLIINEHKNNIKENEYNNWT